MTVALRMRFSQIPELVSPCCPQHPEHLPPPAEGVIWGELPKYSAGTWAFGPVWVWKQQQQFYTEINGFHCKMDTLTSTGESEWLAVSAAEPEMFPQQHL